MASTYNLSGELPNGGRYCVCVAGPVPSKIFRHIVAVISMSADFLEEDEISACRPMELGDIMLPSPTGAGAGAGGE